MIVDRQHRAARLEHVGRLDVLVDEADVADLVDRIVPWLRLRARDAGDERTRPEAALAAVAATRGRDPAPRLARRWLAELVELTGDPAGLLAGDGFGLGGAGGRRRTPPRRGSPA
mgnify:CR=1 FL=1